MTGLTGLTGQPELTPGWGREEGGRVPKGCSAANSTTVCWLERLRKNHTLKIKAPDCHQGCSGFAPSPWLQCPELSAQISVKASVFPLDSEL